MVLVVGICLLAPFGISFAEEIDPYPISCAEHGELSEDEVSIWIILNGEYKFCSLCITTFWKNNYKEVRRLMENMKGE